MTLVVGLIGGIGAGKSTVARRLKERGAVILDGDRIGYEVLTEPAVRQALAARFGTGIFAADGSIDRRALGAIVFEDPKRLRELERVMHPRMRSILEARIAQAKQTPETPLVVVDAAVLFEAGWNDLCDRVLFVDSPRAQRLARVAQSRGWSEIELEQRERAQWPLAEKKQRAHDVIHNDGTVDDCHRRVDQWFEEEVVARRRPPEQMVQQ